MVIVKLTILNWNFDSMVVESETYMATFKMPALCLVCDKRCDGQFYCSDECYEKDQARINRETLDNFFGEFKEPKYKKTDKGLEFIK